MTNIVILTGAGISADSGVSTFRDADGLWQKYPLEDVATPEGFARNPALVHEFYNNRRANLKDVQPNPAHTALVQLEQATIKAGGDFTLVTQNVDDLHQRAGSNHVFPIHGELLKARCLSCGAIHAWAEDLSIETKCPNCGADHHESPQGQGFGMRPHIVWFGEIPFYMNAIEEALIKADIFISIGTSGNVYPAAGMVHSAKEMGIKTVELNLEPSENAAAFDDAKYGKASDIVPAYVAQLIN